MTHFLRDKNNNSVVDIDATPKDLSAGVIIPAFAAILLALPEDKQLDFINDMDGLAELRGEFWETPRRAQAKPIEGLETPDELCERRCREVGEKWDLWYVTD